MKVVVGICLLGSVYVVGYQVQWVCVSHVAPSLLLPQLREGWAEAIHPPSKRLFVFITFTTVSHIIPLFLPFVYVVGGMGVEKWFGWV